MKKGNRGFVGKIVLIIVALALLKYFFNWSIFDAADSEQGKGTIEYIRQVLNTIWAYIEKPILFVWNNILWPVLEIMWDSFQDLIRLIKSRT